MDRIALLEELATVGLRLPGDLVDRMRRDLAARCQAEPLAVVPSFD